jgi:hypothetical protein
MKYDIRIALARAFIALVAVLASTFGAKYLAPGLYADLKPVVEELVTVAILVALGIDLDAYRRSKTVSYAEDAPKVEPE